MYFLFKKKKSFLKIINLFSIFKVKEKIEITLKN